MEFRTATKEEVKQVLAGEKTLPLLPLALNMVGCATQEEMNSNLTDTIKRGYTPINEFLDKSKGTCSLVGSGPSIKDTWTELKGDVMAINSSIRFLVDKGVIPKWAMLWDAADIVSKFVVPHPDITYLVGSRCHPSVFEALKDCKVVVWHAGGDHNINEVIIKNNIKEPLVNGGSAGVTRGIYLVSALGYRDIHVFGADSSYNGNDTHVSGSLVPEKDIMVSIGNEPPKWFRTTPEWCAQVEEFRCIYAMFTCNDNHKVEVYGEGTMIKYMHDLLKAKKVELGQEKFIENISAQETHRQKLSEMASQQEAQRASV